MRRLPHMGARVVVAVEAPLAAGAVGGACDEDGGWTAPRLGEFGAAVLRDGATLQSLLSRCFVRASLKVT